MQVQQSIRAHNAAILQLVNRLQDAKEVLETCLDGVSKETVAIKQARDSKTSFADLISYAAKLSRFTSAPPNFDPMTFNPLMEKPYPEEIRMRQGILYQGRVLALDTVGMSADDVRKLGDEQSSEMEDDKDDHDDDRDDEMPHGFAQILGAAKKDELLNFELNL